MKFKPKSNKGRHLPRLRGNKEYESPIGEYRVAKGMTIQDLKRASGVHQTVISGLQNGTISPIYLSRKAGKIKPDAESICRVLGISIEDAFPRYFCRIRQVGKDFTPDQILSISNGQQPPDPLKTITRIEAISTLRHIISSVLSRRQYLVLSRHFGFEDENPRSCIKIAEDLGLSSQRVFQIKRNAISRLVNTRAKVQLRECFEEITR